MTLRGKGALLGFGEPVGVSPVRTCLEQLEKYRI
jgi:hypothetical protein